MGVAFPLLHLAFAAPNFCCCTAWRDFTAGTKRQQHWRFARHVSAMQEVAGRTSTSHAGYVQKQHPVGNTLERTLIWKIVCKTTPTREICLLSLYIYNWTSIHHYVVTLFSGITLPSNELIQGCTELNLIQTNSIKRVVQYFF